MGRVRNGQQTHYHLFSGMAGEQGVEVAKPPKRLTMRIKNQGSNDISYSAGPARLKDVELELWCNVGPCSSG